MRKLFGITKFVLLCCILAIIVVYLSAVFRPRKTDFPNDTTNKVSGFYALQQDSMDILLMGTSHTYYGFNPSIIYEKTGLNSYVFAGECQPISVTYHYLVEALKTQHPQLIVLDVFALLPSADKCQTEGIIKVNLEDFKFSKNKLEALQLIKNESAWQNLLDISIYKDRWNEITMEDFYFPLKDHFNESFGYTSGYPVDDPLYVREMYFSDEIEIPDKEELSYLYKIFSLAKENDIDVLVVKTPYYESYQEYKITNYIFQEAQEYGFQTLNFNQYYDALDYVFDRDGDVWHCNVRGAWKITHMLSDYIKAHYNISISESVYEEAYHNQYVRTLQNLFWSQTDAMAYLDYLKDMNMVLLVNYEGKSECNLTQDQWNALKALGIKKFDPHRNYLAVIHQGEIIYEINHDEDFTEWVEVQGTSLAVSSYDDFVIFDVAGDNVEFNHYGLNIQVYDVKKQQLLDKISLDTIWGFEILR